MHELLHCAQLPLRPLQALPGSVTHLCEAQRELYVITLNQKELMLMSS